MIESLYVHFPFCETKCHYCDFYSLGKDRARPSDPDLFEKALNRECAQSAELLAPRLDTIFFGGGTPSMTSPESMMRALEPLNLSSRIDDQTEWTMEANPSSIHYEAMKLYRQMGINRVSMGVQSMREEHLTLLGRVHSRQAAIEALTQVFEAGFENVSVDLLCGVPNQTLEDLESGMEALTGFPITHLSCYLLTLPKHHRMYPQLPDEETQLSHLLFIDKKMREKGFDHYEISNFAKPGKQARHNLHYWKGQSYLGLGPSAHSFDASLGKRWKNVSSLHRYSDLLNQGKSVMEWSEALTEEQSHLEKWMLALRLSDGFPASWLTTDLQKARAASFEAEGLLENHPERSQFRRLTPRGFALSDQIIAALT
jgi:oxygen-independent coproporphyrinogen-3 oxidase